MPTRRHVCLGQRATFLALIIGLNYSFVISSSFGRGQTLLYSKSFSRDIVEEKNSTGRQVLRKFVEIGEEGRRGE